ncbi:MAG: class I SAM-dependent methyltransferase [Desulfurivibrionaceae bacterium]
MNAAREYPALQPSSRSLWEIKARRYPLPFDLQNLAKTNRVMALLKEWGVGCAGGRILDIGCGTGCFALPLARKAIKVVGIDFSAAMLDRLLAEAARFRIHNVQVQRMAWQEVDPVRLDLAGAFDVVWTSMSAAVRSAADLARMEQCSRRWCVYTGWGRVRENPLLAEAFRMHGLVFAPPPGVAAMHALVTKAGRQTFLEYLDTFWEWEGSVNEALDDLASHIETAGATARRPALQGLLDGYQRNGVIRHITRAEEGVMAWRVD